MTEAIKARAIAAMGEIFVTRGKNKGMLLAKAPPSQTDAYAAWQGAMMACNPYKASIFGMMIMTPEQSEIMRFVDKVFSTVKGAPLLERNRLALETLGAW